jgi:hypothetical protein
MNQMIVSLVMMCSIVREFGLGFEPRRPDAKDSFSFDPERHRTRMNWLYGRLAEEGEKHTYTVAAKEYDILPVHFFAFHF